MLDGELAFVSRLNSAIHSTSVIALMFSTGTMWPIQSARLAGPKLEVPAGLLQPALETVSRQFVVDRLDVKRAAMSDRARARVPVVIARTMEGFFALYSA